MIEKLACIHFASGVEICGNYRCSLEIARS